MTTFITQAEVSRLRQAPPGSFQQKLYAALRDRAHRHTRYPGFVQPGDTQEWWHLCWERASDAAFVWHMERDAGIGEWLRAAAFRLRDLDEDEWQGPWFRPHEHPQVGSLETAHAALAMCEILDLAGALFTPEETERLKNVLRVRGMEPCLRFCESVITGAKIIQNWYNVLLMGYGVSALALNDAAAIEKTFRLLRYAYGVYNSDSYGESLQYSNYASLTLSYLNELMLRRFPERADEIDLTCYGRLMPWYAASFLGMKPWDANGEKWPRSLNYGDSAAVFRPTGDLLAQVACRLKHALPREAALASWLLETCYADPAQGPDELATFGMYNQFGYHAVLMEPDRVPAASPARVGLGPDLAFECGQVILRNRWEGPQSALAVQAGYQPLNASGHRHQDHGAIQYVFGGERLIVDGGHCCYRLQTQAFTASAFNHAVFDFATQEGETLCQKKAGGCFLDREAPLARNLMNERVGRAHVLAVDLTDAFDEQVTVALRAVISVMPHAFFIIDRAETKVPLIMRTHFPINNRDNQTRVHRADEHRLVFRRCGQGMKLFECVSEPDGQSVPSRMVCRWGYCHQHYHSLPNQACQGKEGSAAIYSWEENAPAASHLRICAVAADCEPRITGWHIKPGAQGEWYIESPEKNRLLVLRIQDGHVYLSGEDDTLIL